MTRLCTHCMMYKPRNGGGMKHPESTKYNARPRWMCEDCWNRRRKQ